MLSAFIDENGHLTNCRNCVFVSGCRAALVNVEAQPISALSFLRKCVVAKMKDLTIDRFKDAMQQNAGGLLIIIPSNLSQLSDTEKEVCTVMYENFFLHRIWLLHITAVVVVQ